MIDIERLSYLAQKLREMAESHKHASTAIREEHLRNLMINYAEALELIAKEIEECLKTL